MDSAAVGVASFCALAKTENPHVKIQHDLLRYTLDEHGHPMWNELLNCTSSPEGELDTVSRVPATNPVRGAEFGKYRRIKQGGLLVNLKSCPVVGVNPGSIGRQI